MLASPYLLEPPQGQSRHSANPEDNSSQVIVAGVATTVVASLALAARIFARLHVLKNAGSDDYLAIVAMCLSLAFCGTTFNATRLGAGKHMWYMLVSDYSPYFLAGNIGITITYSLSVSFSKLSILVLYLRLSPDANFRRVVYSVISVVIAYTLAYELIIIFQCRPVAAAWDIAVKGTCLKPMIQMMVFSSLNILIDLITLALPVKLFLELQMSIRQRMSLIAMFGAGSFVCAVAIQRTIILPHLLNSSDYTWDVVPQMVWGFLEVNTGVVCAALPASKPLFTRYLPRFLSSRSRDSSRRKSGSLPLPESLGGDRKRRGNGPHAPFAGNSGGRNLDEPGSEDDDEMYLWPSRGKGSARNGKSIPEQISLESLHDTTYGIQNKVRTVVSAAPDSTKIVRHSMAHSITVTTETRIER
ncbi:hypothetical protein P171DRAFT_524858 [Karstenula rhodostoma CBS 690.94]|uniref:Rhodopsin domain-containing protein n=1 Tax=Karstenula rhodostoma CBS 690.94 TaxID=1392251 RepID=A0A9P4PAT0_9PLEO|nr:hypothetical protein P171DRAFT_524858 [Karstenula rhodostoma CBS 690.94]